jgi:mannosyltransferase OCH1-like enzyme
MVRTTTITPRRIFLIDTSYLLELFGIPGHSTPEVTFKIEQRYNQALKDRNRLVVPLPCIFELGNHIAQVRNGYYRREIANILLNMIKTSVRTDKPWTITPATGVEFLPELFEGFTHNYVVQSIGLVDTFIIQEAKYLKNPYNQVHIWTKDQALKAYEPDVEEAPFVG